MEAKHSFFDSRGHAFIDCTECSRGVNGSDKDKCSAGHRNKRPRQGGCFCGTLIEGLEIVRKPTPEVSA